MGCEEVTNRGLQLEDLILKHNLILPNNKNCTYIHPASGTFTSLSSPLLFLDFSWKVGPSPCSDHFPINMKNGGPLSLVT